MAEFATKGVGAAGLTTGIIGSALGVLNGGLGNLGVLGGGGYGMCGANAAAIYGCSDNMAVNRYEATQSARIAELETEVKLRDANFYTLSEMGKLRDYVDRRIERVEGEICDQKTLNATIVANMSCMANQIAALNGLTKLVVPNSSICPGWGEVTVTPTPAADAAAAG